MLPKNFSSELYHYGVLGMKWGVRRYQNKDGTLTNAGKKRLARELKTEYKKNLVTSGSREPGDAYNKKLVSAIEQNITDEDRRRLSDARRKWESSWDDADEALNSLLKIGDKYTKEFCDEIIRKDPDVYVTDRDKQKLYDYALYDVGLSKASAERPDLAKIYNDSEDNFKEYMNECSRMVNKVIGKYGDTVLDRSGRYPPDIEATVHNMISQLERQNWNSKM